jgi:hypothetical protein
MEDFDSNYTTLAFLRRLRPSSSGSPGGSPWTRAWTRLHISRSETTFRGARAIGIELSNSGVGEIIALRGNARPHYDQGSSREVNG